jgi:hypothetical protein
MLGSALFAPSASFHLALVFVKKTALGHFPPIGLKPRLKTSLRESKWRGNYKVSKAAKVKISSASILAAFLPTVRVKAESFEFCRQIWQFRIEFNRWINPHFYETDDKNTWIWHVKCVGYCRTQIIRHKNFYLRFYFLKTIGKLKLRWHDSTKKHSNDGAAQGARFFWEKIPKRKQK